MRQNQGPSLNNSTDVVGHERLDETEADAETIRAKTAEPPPSNDAILDGIIAKSSFDVIYADNIVTESEGKFPTCIINGVAAYSVGHEGGDNNDTPTNPRQHMPTSSWSDNLPLDGPVVNSHQGGSKFPEKNAIQRQVLGAIHHASKVPKAGLFYHPQ